MEAALYSQLSKKQSTERDYVKVILDLVELQLWVEFNVILFFFKILAVIRSHTLITSEQNINKSLPIHVTICWRQQQFNRVQGCLQWEMEISKMEPYGHFIIWQITYIIFKLFLQSKFSLEDEWVIL